MEMRWIFPPKEGSGAVQQVRSDFKLPRALSEVLVKRHHTGDNLSSFLSPRLGDLTAPELLPGTNEAADILHQAIASKSNIVLYGDYDVDGVCSLALLQRVLRELGGQVSCFLPHRTEEGYGLTAEGVDRCLQELKPDLLVAVDCGTTSSEQVTRLRRSGVSVVVLDHHEPGSSPADTLIVNPKLRGQEYSYLCSAGVCFKVLHALLKSYGTDGIDLKDYLDLVAMATVADIVPLVGENRILVWRGLAQLTSSRWPGVRELARVAGIEGTIASSDVGFRLGPRLNAAGRLGTALDSLSLLLSDDVESAKALALRVDNQNRERQSVEKGVADEAELWVEAHFDPGRDLSIVAGGREWHQGVVGIVAARIARRHHRPTIIVGFDQAGTGKGSCRSIEGLSLVDTLAECSSLLERYGGHAMAAGISISEGQFEPFRCAFERSVRASTTSELFTPHLHLDAELPLAEIDDLFLTAQERLEPFGAENLQPVFYSRNVVPLASPRVLKKKHRKYSFPCGRGRIDAIHFNGNEHPLPSAPWDVAYRVSRNTYNGRSEPQLQVIAVRQSR